MIGGLLLLLQLAIIPPMVVVKAAGKSITLSVLPAGSTSAVASDKLASALGGSVTPIANGRYVLMIGDSRFEFVDGAPYVLTDSGVVPLTAAPSLVGNTLYIPFHVLSEIIPKYATGVIYDRSIGEIRTFSPVVSSGSKGVTPVAARSAAVRPDSTPAKAARPHEKRLVVIDAGHGGPDNGMTGPIGAGPKIKEKHIALAVSKLVAQYVKEDGYRVLMTRSKDTLIALSDRGRIANDARGDVFVSIHVNATGQSGARGARDRGFETYFLAEAKTEEAARVERMENEAVRFETDVNAPKGDPLNFIIKDMAQNEHLRESYELATLVQNGFKTFHPGPSRGVQQANFAVLRGSYMPAVLIEIGFGTNPSEAAYISDADNQKKLARSITKAILEYLDRYEARLQAGGK